MKKKIIIAALVGATTGLGLAYINLMTEYNKLLKQNNTLTKTLLDVADVIKDRLDKTKEAEHEKKEEKVNEEPKKETPVERSFIFTRSLHFKNSEEAKNFILWWNDKIDNSMRVTYTDICEKLRFTTLDIAAHYDKRINLDDILFSTIDNSYKIILPVAIIDQYTNEE